MRDDVEITVLVDEHAGEGLMAEHGLSLWIAAGTRRILFDTGQGAALVLNARQLGVALEETETVVLSHGHYDHTGGLGDVLTRAPTANLVLHPDAVTRRYSVGPSQAGRSIGMPDDVRALVERRSGDKVTWSDRPVHLAPNIGVTGPIVRRMSLEHSSGRFFLDDRGQAPDPITDDQALWIATPAGLVVCVGCSHAGLVNTLDQVRHLTGVSTVRAVIGGFHLIDADGQRLRHTIEALRAIGPELLAPCHCTGDRAVGLLKEAFGARMSPCHSGAVYRFGST
jgi:7,8-dihydropterin-6-yl-methyl-4-(beta-D-ribofuranosyl)aminobenzene 5'-phosphate synthase